MSNHYNAVSLFTRVVSLFLSQKIDLPALKQLIEKSISHPLPDDTVRDLLLLSFRLDSKKFRNCLFTPAEDDSKLATQLVETLF